MKAYGTRAQRWSDNDRYFGPFTFAYSPTYKDIGVTIQSDVHEDRDEGTSSLRIRLGGATMIWVLPWQIVKPRIERHYANFDAETVTRLGHNYYDTAMTRQFGFSFSHTGAIGDSVMFQLFRGARTFDSSTDRTWSCSLPWTEWRHVRWSLYDLEGRHFWSDIDAEAAGYLKLGKSMDRYELRRKWEEMCPTRKFVIRDYDGAEIVCTTKIEEREWRWGRKPFEWLSWFKKPMIRRSLDLTFDKEVGPEKGSWKGGLIGHGFAMLPGELHEAAMRRYCEQEHRAKRTPYRITFVGPA